MQMDNSQNGEKEYDTWILLSRVYHMIAKLRRLELAKYNVQPVQAYILFILHALGDDTSRQNWPDMRMKIKAQFQISSFAWKNRA